MVVCTLTSNLQRAKAPGNVLLKKGEGGLPRDCVANISQIITVDKNDLSEKIGSLKQDKIRLILDGIRLLIEPRTL